MVIIYGHLDVSILDININNPYDAGTKPNTSTIVKNVCMLYNFYCELIVARPRSYSLTTLLFFLPNIVML